MTILQGVRAFLDGSLNTKAGGETEGVSPADVDGSSGGDQQQPPPVDVVFKKGIRVDGTNEPDRDEALSEVSLQDRY